ncbi:MAG: nitroreductase [Pseudomonadota bacterium]
MPPDFPPAPALSDALAATHPSSETLALLAGRRSTVAKDMGEPGPDPQTLAGLLRLAMRVPDHGKIAPWRFVLIEGSARSALGDALEEAFAEHDPLAAQDAERVQFERSRLLRAPTVVTVISAPDVGHKVPVWEQHLSAGAVCQTLLTACSAAGFAAQWLTEWYAYSPRMHRALGVKDPEQIAGFVYIGTATSQPIERARPSPDEKVRAWTPDLSLNE